MSGEGTHWGYLKQRDGGAGVPVGVGGANDQGAFQFQRLLSHPFTFIGTKHIHTSRKNARIHKNKYILLF